MQISENDLTEFFYVLDQIHPSDEAVKDYFSHHLTPLQCKKGNLLLQAGTICEWIYFIKKGIVRGFITENKKDMTTWITAEYEIVTSISGLGLSTPALENIEAIEDCSLLAMRTEQLQDLYQVHPGFNITGRKLLQKYYRDAEIRALIIRLTNAEKKYIFFLENYPNLANRIPLKYIASFLGMTIETLSRVRKKISI